MKSINQLVLLSVIFGLVAGLIFSPISVKPIFAEPPDPCFGYGCLDSNCYELFPYPHQGVQCCWTGPNDSLKQICQICNYDPDGNLLDCETPTTKGISDSSVVAPPPSGKAPPPSTEKCPDDSAVDYKGNCTPTTQLPGDTSDNNKPNLRGNILNDLMSTQSQDSSNSGEEQENQSNG